MDKQVIIYKLQKYQDKLDQNTYGQTSKNVLYKQNVRYYLKELEGGVDPRPGYTPATNTLTHAQTKPNSMYVSTVVPTTSSKYATLYATLNDTLGRPRTASPVETAYGTLKRPTYATLDPSTREHVYNVRPSNGEYSRLVRSGPYNVVRPTTSGWSSYSSTTPSPSSSPYNVVPSTPSTYVYNVPWQNLSLVKHNFFFEFNGFLNPHNVDNAQNIVKQLRTLLLRGHNVFIVSSGNSFKIAEYIMKILQSILHIRNISISTSLEGYCNIVSFNGLKITVYGAKFDRQTGNFDWSSNENMCPSSLKYKTTLPQEVPQIDVHHVIKIIKDTFGPSIYTINDNRKYVDIYYYFTNLCTLVRDIYSEKTFWAYIKIFFILHAKHSNKLNDNIHFFDTNTLNIDTANKVMKYPTNDRERLTKAINAHLFTNPNETFEYIYTNILNLHSRV